MAPRIYVIPVLLKHHAEPYAGLPITLLAKLVKS